MRLGQAMSGEEGGCGVREQRWGRGQGNVKIQDPTSFRATPFRGRRFWIFAIAKTWGEREVDGEGDGGPLSPFPRPLGEADANRR